MASSQCTSVLNFAMIKPEQALESMTYPQDKYPIIRHPSTSMQNELWLFDGPVQREHPRGLGLGGRGVDDVPSLSTGTVPGGGGGGVVLL